MGKLQYHEITTTGKRDATIVSLLLARRIGRDCYRIGVNKERNEYTASFWGTVEEFDEIVEDLEDAALEMLNDEYFELLANGD